jgi:hypothetical protein
MKRLVVVFAFIAMFLLSGCEALSRETEYFLDNNNISLTLPKAWEKSTNEANDLTLTKSSAKLSMIVLKKSEIEEESAEKLLNNIIKEKLSEMDDNKLLKAYNPNKTRDRIIYSKLYTAGKDGYEKQYFFNVLEFTGSDTYVYVMYEAKETYMNYNIDDIQRILIRMKWNGEERDLAMN